MQLLCWPTGTQHEECPLQLVSRRLTRPALYLHAAHIQDRKPMFCAVLKKARPVATISQKRAKYFTRMSSIILSQVGNFNTILTNLPTNKK